MMLIDVDRIFDLKVGEWDSHLAHGFLVVEDLLEVNNFLLFFATQIFFSFFSFLVFCLDLLLLSIGL